MNRNGVELGFTHILCGVDGSDEACRAADVAARLARAFDASLTFVAVAQKAGDSPDLVHYRQTEGLSPEDTVPMLAGDAEACLTAALQIAKGLGIDHANRIVRTGKVAHAILSLSTEIKADTLVLGHHTRSSIGRAVKRSLSSMIADTNSMKVLLVP